MSEEEIWPPPIYPWEREWPSVVQVRLLRDGIGGYVDAEGYLWSSVSGAEGRPCDLCGRACGWATYSPGGGVYLCHHCVVFYGVVLTCHDCGARYHLPYSVDWPWPAGGPPPELAPDPATFGRCRAVVALRVRSKTERRCGGQLHTDAAGVAA